MGEVSIKASNYDGFGQSLGVNPYCTVTLLFTAINYYTSPENDTGTQRLSFVLIFAFNQCADYYNYSVRFHFQSHHNYDLVEHFSLDDVDSAFELITQVKYNQSIPMRGLYLLNI